MTQKFLQRLSLKIKMHMRLNLCITKEEKQLLELLFKRLNKGMTLEEDWKLCNYPHTKEKEIGKATKITEESTQEKVSTTQDTE